ncbi:4'-phosphopantetheinyl transferase family protein [Nitrosococcus wardiae]|uniref:Enterobactin synthase component D n=1 Tax=Nitrosococcus wardiae TaxID=1814290 RepID=A0A4P7BYR5_9GAMM|nr:4'-phosphopantetheinyl transferase superfamily protein [Nitrosococcus wardiae]QBQ55221.1 4'-phosphopantetheinyl transferase superfamily protein [Nitrosococcus wardiae]
MYDASSTSSTLATISQWGPGLIFSQCSYHELPIPPLFCQQLGLELPTSVQQAASKRQAEYVAGRICAQAAIKALQHKPVFPDMGPNRAPQWPTGLTGAITHANGQAAALVGLGHHWQGIGLDRERILPEREAQEIAGDILTPSEKSRLDRLPGPQRGQWVSLAFSAKESLFKALFPLTHQPFYFHDAELIDEQHIRLLTTLSDRWKEDKILRFNWRQERDQLLSWMLIQAEADQ